MELVKLLFGSGWMVAWHLAMWLLAALFVVMPIKMLSDDALKVPAPTPTLGTMGMMILPVFFFLALTAMNGAIAIRAFDAGALGRAGLIFAAATVATVLMIAGFWTMLEYPGRASVSALWAIATVLMLLNLWLARVGVTRDANSIAVPGGWVATTLLVVIGLPSAIFLALFVLALMKRE